MEWYVDGYADWSLSEAEKISAQADEQIEKFKLKVAEILDDIEVQ